VSMVMGEWRSRALYVASKISLVRVSFQVIFDKCMAQSSVLRVDTLEQLLARVWFEIGARD
jgi:hypothetical protein